MVRRKKDKEEIGGSVSVKSKFEDLHGILNGSEKVVHGLSGAYHSAKHLVGGAIHHHHHHHHHYHGESGGDIFGAIGNAFDPAKNGLNKSVKNTVNDLKTAGQYAIPALSAGLGGLAGGVAGGVATGGLGGEFVGGAAGSALGAYGGHEINRSLGIQNNKDFSGSGLGCGIHHKSKVALAGLLGGAEGSTIAHYADNYVNRGTGLKHKSKVALAGLLGGAEGSTIAHYADNYVNKGTGLKRKGRFEKGSPEAKAFMQRLRDARKK